MDLINMRLSMVLLMFVVVGLSESQWPEREKSPIHAGLPRKQRIQEKKQRVAGVLPQDTHAFNPTGPAKVSLNQHSWNPLQAPVQRPSNVQSQQVLQGPVKQVNWHFPQESWLPARQPQVQFEMPHLTPARSVAAECGEGEIRVEVRKDLFGTGELIDPAGLTLGSCPVSGEDRSAQVLIFQAQLQACNSTAIMTQGELVYVFFLHYVPVHLAQTPIVRTIDAVVGIECHYPRLHNVTSNALMPAWIPYASTQTAGEQLVFILRLMTDDWQSERTSNQYFLNDVINIEASVIQFHHVPLRVYLDRCLATVVPDVEAVPRYAFIDNYGCLVDAKITGSQSHFLPQTEVDKLRFQLEAFKFQQDNSGLIYFTCFMKATVASVSADAVHKACSFSGNRWIAASGDNQVCGCCDGTCGSLTWSDTPVGKGPQLEKRVTFGPIMVKERV